MTTDIGLARSYGRSAGEKRPTVLTREYVDSAAGSCLVETGRTRVLCAVTVEDRAPAWLKGSGRGWVTAEYAMLPASTAKRTPREWRGRKGRSMEIERLIGRSLRTVCDLTALGGEVTFHVDCDVIQADGGTRTASITGAWVALHDAIEKQRAIGKISGNPLTGQVAAISAGKVGGRLLLDLDYQEDSSAEVDLNVVMDANGGIIEVQGTGESTPFTRGELDRLLDMAAVGIGELQAAQREVLAG